MRVTELKDIGKGSSLIIVGGGHSAAEFDFSKTTHDVMTLNDSLYVNDKWVTIPKYLMYYDWNMLKVLRKMHINKTTKVIGYNNSFWASMDFDYNMADCYPAKQSHCIAAKALIMAKKVMAYDSIYLVGIDFYAKEIGGKITSHFQGDKIGIGEKYNDETHFKTHLQNLDRSEEFNDLNYENVYNCNPNSKLKKYEYKIPY